MTTQNEAPKNTDKLNEVQVSQELASKSPVDKNSPLFIIREKELEFKKYLEKTQKEAYKIVEGAKKESEKLIEKIDSEGEKKAQDYFTNEFEKANNEAKKLRDAAPTKAKNTQETGLKNLSKAINQLKVILAPSR